VAKDGHHFYTHHVTAESVEGPRDRGRDVKCPEEDGVSTETRGATLTTSHCRFLRAFIVGLIWFRSSGLYPYIQRHPITLFTKPHNTAAVAQGGRAVLWQQEGCWFDPQLHLPTVSVEVSLSKTPPSPNCSRHADCCLPWLTPNV